jgi:hypothetical protein
MLSKTSWVRLACVLVVIGWAASAAAQQKIYGLAGDGGFWIGGGMPVPVTKGSPPNSMLKASGPTAHVLQTLGPDPVQMRIPPGQMKKPLGRNFAGQFLNNQKLMQVSTTLSMKFPATSGVGVNNPHADGSAIFKAGGRTGAPTLTWCPGWTAANPPTCANPNTKGLNGMLTYRKTAAQFGGPAQASIGGKATIFAVAGSPPPCKHVALGGPDANCLAIVAYASVPPLVAAGAPFGYANATTPIQKLPLNIYVVSANANGSIGLKAPAAYAPFVNSATSYGGPWSTGQITIQQTAAIGAAETFTITGGDARVSGVGAISLVSGAVSQRAASGPNANRGWLNLVVGTKTPSLPGWGIGALGLLLLGGGYARLSLARRKK